MEIRHKGKVIADKVKILKNSIEKARGLILRPKIKAKEGFLFCFNKEGYWSFHMFFMSYPIDILWLDSTKRVVDMIKGFKPYSIYKPKKKARYVLEMREGTISQHKISKRDMLEFEINGK